MKKKDCRKASINELLTKLAEISKSLSTNKDTTKLEKVEEIVLEELKYKMSRAQ